MGNSEFIKILRAKGIYYTLEGSTITITSENMNNIDLEDVKALPPYTVFKNRGNVNLTYLTILPEGIIFDNGGSVNLTYLTILPASTIFNNRCMVSLFGITNPHLDVIFNNNSYVCLPYRFHDTAITYLGKPLLIAIHDGATLSVLGRRTVKDFTVYKVKYFEGVNAPSSLSYFVVEQGERTGFGVTIKQAIVDYNLRAPQ